ncbi:MAG: transporter permease [Firmicutes bacterium]|nr:transporter permease [Bacillota bacterium]
MPILLLPGVFFVLYAGMYARSGMSVETFGAYIPMYMLLISFLTVFFNIGTQYVTDRELGIIKRLVISPIKIYNVMLTYLIRGLLISILGFFEMIFLATIIFHIPLSNNMILYFISFCVMVGIMMMLSLAIHGFFKNSRQVTPFTIIIFQYVLFASGMLMPVEKMPLALRILVYFNPVYHMNRILMKVWYGKWFDLKNVAALAAVLAICCIIFKIQKQFKTDK